MPTIKEQMDAGVERRKKGVGLEKYNSNHDELGRFTGGGGSGGGGSNKNAGMLSDATNHAAYQAKVSEMTARHYQEAKALHEQHFEEASEAASQGKLPDLETQRTQVSNMMLRHSNDHHALHGQFYKS